MKMITCFGYVLRRRLFSTKVKIVPALNVNVQENIESKQISPKKHPGVLKINPPEVPDKLFDSIKYILRDKTVRNMMPECNAFVRYLEGRHAPKDKEEIKEHENKIKKISARSCGINLEETDYAELPFKKKLVLNSKYNNLYNKLTYNWKPVNYDEHMSLIYMMSRAAPEYSVLNRVFNEINMRDEAFKPASLFDFGSGIGMVTWSAKHYWSDSLKEFYCVDSSSHMNNIAQALIQNGKMNMETPRGVYFRQFLPSHHMLYDLVVSAYSLFELPSKQARLDTILNLWQKTKHYLVLVERGTLSGFKVLNEARDFILFGNISNQKHFYKAHVFAPCPHDSACPRIIDNDRLTNKETPCNFEINYHKLPLDDKDKLMKERFSFVILKKGKREENDEQWPRVVRPVLKPSGHCISRLCTADGKLQEVIFSAAKHGKTTYKCACYSKWGDVLPVKLSNIEVSKDVNNTDDKFTESFEKEIDNDGGRNL